ncbi:hypothetical protein [Herbaspirillum lusitanum]|uniref:hypothetical protein n=1 Tax=Herbaspirillum lusitanum TaxID=213312 RepID=UPI0002F85AEB|nr:hypothetical protein [Herbaspirillum lusitanum]
MKIFFGIFISFIFATFVFNTYVDIAGQQSGNFVYELSQSQKENQVLTWDRLFDQRIWLNARFDSMQLKDCPEVLILSSSTLGGIDSSNFPKRKFLNGWMAAPSIEDFEATTHLIEQSNCPHLEIWMGMDPWFFNAKEKSDRWTSAIQPFTSYQIDHGDIFRSIKGYSSFWSRAKDRLSYVTTRESLLYFKTHLGDVTYLDKPKLIAVGPSLDKLCSSTKSELYLRAQDGHFFGCPRFSLTQEQISYLSSTYLERNTHGMREWQQVDTDVVQRLSTIMNVLTKRGHRIVLIAPVYHPTTYNSLIANEHVQSKLNFIDARMKELAYRHGSSFVNLRNPQIPGCTASEFEDSHHAGADCLKKEVAAIAHRSDSSN